MTESPRFLVLGAGGLGCPALLGLSCAPTLWPIAVVDADVVDASNLQRQVLYTIADVGAPKVDAARHRLRSRRPDIRVQPVNERLTISALARHIEALPRGSVVLECTDDPRLKFAANDLCLHFGVDLVVGGVVGWGGQVMAVRAPQACFRCIFEAPPPEELAPNCAAAGVMGTAAGLLGHAMAMLALRMIEDDAGAILQGSDASPVAGTLTVADLRSAGIRTLSPPPRPDCPACRGPARELRTILQELGATGANAGAEQR